MPTAARALSGFILGFAMVAGAQAQVSKPAWCRALPRPEYRHLQRVPVNDSWFEVYEVAPKVFAIYEPHQEEEAISFLDRKSVV